MATDERSTNTDQIVGVLTDAGSPLKTADIADATGMEGPRVSSTLSNLVASGRVVRVGLSTYTTPELASSQGLEVLKPRARKSSSRKRAGTKRAAGKAAAKKSAGTKASSKRAASKRAASRRTSAKKAAGAPPAGGSPAQAATPQAAPARRARRSSGGGTSRRRSSRSAPAATEFTPAESEEQFSLLGTFDDQLLLQDSSGKLWAAKPAQITA